MAYSELQADRITVTLTRLQARVTERFPERGLATVCAELLAISRAHAERLREVSRPNLKLRALVTLVLAGGIAAIGWGIYQKVLLLQDNLGEVYSFEGVEAIANMILLVGAGVWFLLNLEARFKRTKALQALHELRSIAHVIDMHQLTKDPTSFVLDHQRTPSSPERDLSPFELMRYLDYSAEMLSLTGKLAALYLQKLNDPVVADAVNEIESLTGNFSSKIWQKIMIVRTEIDPASVKRT